MLHWAKRCLTDPLQCEDDHYIFHITEVMGYEVRLFPCFSFVTKTKNKLVHKQRPGLVGNFDGCKNFFYVIYSIRSFFKLKSKVKTFHPWDYFDLCIYSNFGGRHFEFVSKHESI